jgi:hypothetical protein
MWPVTREWRKLHNFELHNLYVKITLSLCLTKYHATKACCGIGGVTPRILNSELDGVEWSASRPGCFNSAERHRYPFMEGWVDSRTSLEAVAKTKMSFPCSCPKSNPGRPVCRLVTILTELLQLHSDLKFN